MISLTSESTDMKKGLFCGNYYNIEIAKPEGLSFFNHHMTSNDSTTNTSAQLPSLAPPKETMITIYAREYRQLKTDVLSAHFINLEFPRSVRSTKELSRFSKKAFSLMFCLEAFRHFQTNLHLSRWHAQRYKISYIVKNVYMKSCGVSVPEKALFACSMIFSKTYISCSLISVRSVRRRAEKGGDWWRLEKNFISCEHNFICDWHGSGVRIKRCFAVRITVGFNLIVYLTTLLQLSDDHESDNPQPKSTFHLFWESTHSDNISTLISASQTMQFLWHSVFHLSFAPPSEKLVVTRSLLWPVLPRLTAVPWW